MTSFKDIVFGALVLSALPASAAKAGTLEKSDSAPANANSHPGGLDTTAIRALYMGGDFGPAIKKLESDRQEGRLQSHQDSVFAFKHLGVMYAANYETVERGKQLMYLLLSIEPTVKIMDMYASDMIYMIFHNVQEEFELRHARPKYVDAHPVQADSVRPGNTGRKVWPYWTAGGVALAAGVGVAAYFLFGNSSPDPVHYNGELK
ncbi:MAG: hypothetical protein JWO30_2003 [Fibrobacteres bacterium]|nr:hypothetical protein [Fibrobacterota bacterium]